MNETEILIEIKNIKRVLAWMLLDWQVRKTNAPMPEKVKEHWQKEYLWVIDYLPCP